MLQVYVSNQEASHFHLLEESLHDEIAALREQMHRVAEQKKNLSDPAVVKISQLLDQKLNLYDRATNKASLCLT
jgi:hypothetical protein